MAGCYAARRRMLRYIMAWLAVTRLGGGCCDLDFLGFHVSDEGIDHVIDVLRVDVKDWISTVQSDDEEIKRIREILRDDDTKFIADVRNNYQLRGEHVYRIVENGIVLENQKKLLPKFHGPYRILKILPNDRFLVEDTPLSRRGSKMYENIVALDKMHPWLSFKNHSTDDSGTDNDDDIPEE
ncbi:hypothetical protein ACJJTC_006859 [Scirpophaga incertulas]